MRQFQGLTVNGVYYSRDRILDERPAHDDAALTNNARTVLEFCRKWLQGAETFPVQTSGSTGAPRLMQLTRAQMSASARLTAQTFGLRAGARALACLSPAHIGGLMMLVRALELNLDLTVVEPSANPLVNLEAYEPGFDFAAFVPLQLGAILSTDGKHTDALNSMKAILVGGASISAALQQQLQAIQAPVYQTFGMTETASHIALRRLNGASASASYQTLPGVEIAVDGRGCLKIRAKVTQNRWLVTNDRVQLLGEGRFRWLGRIDNVINSGGFKVQAETVEETIGQFLDAEQQELAFVVIPQPDEKLGEKVVAVIEGTEWSDARLDKLMRFVSQRLQKFEVPREVHFVDRLPRTETGKIDRRRVSLLRPLLIRGRNAI